MSKFNFYGVYAPTTSRFFEHTHSTPYAVARSLLRTLGTLPLNHLKSKKSLEPYGICKWGSLDYQRSKRQSTIILHWPTLLRKLPLFVTENAPGIAAFVWQFSDLIRRKSPLAHELLQRQLAHNISLFTESDTNIFELMPEEEEVLVKLMTSIVLHPKMYRAFSEALAMTWSGIADDRKDARSWAVRDMDIDPDEIALFDRGPLSYRFVQQKRTVFKMPVLEGTCYPKTSANFLAQEIYKARHLNTPALGAQVLEDCILIDLRTFIKYRSAFTTDYSAALPKEKYTSRPAPWGESKFFKEDIELRYPEFIYENGAAKFKFPGVDTDNYVYLSDKVVKEYATRAYKLEIARGFRDPASIPPVGEPRILEQISPVLSDLDGRTVKVGVIKHGRFYYFRPGWSVALKATGYHKASPASLRRDFADTIYHKATDELFFKYSKLLSMDAGDLYKSRIFVDWLEQLCHMPPVVFKQRMKEAKIRSRTKNVYSRTPNYTKAEEEAIVKMLRPKMPKEKREELREKCGGRPWGKIVAKGEQLRKKLIEEGVKDIDALPHCNYNAKLRKELQKEKG